MNLPNAEHRARLAAALAAGDPIMLWVKAAADNPGTVDGDVGQWAWILWEVTGEASYARTAITQALKYLTPEPTWGRNELRATTLQWIWMGDRLRPQMTAEEWATWDTRVRYRLSLMLQPDGTGWGTRIGDSDEVIANYFALAAHDAAHGTTYLTDPVADGAAHPTVAYTDSAGVHHRSMRAEIIRMVGLAWNGEWPTGGEYNSSDLHLLFTGNVFSPIPEVTVLLPDAMTQYRWDMMPDFKSLVQWGDVRNPRFFTHVDIGVCALMAGLTGDEQGRALCKIITAAGIHGAHHSFWWGLLLGYDPSQPSPEYVAPEGFRTTGAGLTIHRGTRHLFWSYNPRPLGIDHYVYHTGTCGLVLDGIRRLDHPLLYQGNAPAHNTVLFAGLSSNLTSLGPNEAEETPTGCRIVQRSAGPAQHTRGDVIQPENFLESYVGEIVFTAPGRIEFRDSITGNAPTQVENYNAVQQADINGRWKLWQRVFHSTSQTLPLSHNWPATETFPASKDVAGYGLAGQLDGYQIRLGSDEEGDVAHSAVFDATADVPDPPLPPPPPPPPPVVPPVVPPPPPPPPVETYEQIGDEVIVPTEFGPSIVKSVRLLRKVDA